MTDRLKIRPRRDANVPPAELLATLVADPERIADLPLAEIPALIGLLEAMRFRLELHAMEAAQARPATPQSPSPNGGHPDRLLTAEEVAERMNLRRPRVYQLTREGKLPFARRIDRNTLRFSQSGLEKYMRASNR